MSLSTIFFIAAAIVFGIDSFIVFPSRVKLISLGLLLGTIGLLVGGVAVR